VERWQRLSRLAEEQPRAAREQYAEYRTAAEYRRQKLEADLWTAAFFWPLPKGVEWVPTHGEFMRLRAEGPEALSPQALAQAEALAEQYCFFHWRLEFPDVFSDDGVAQRADSGFDVVLGKPPWEMVNLMQKEFFADKAPEIAGARTGAQRKRLIEGLAKANLQLHAEYSQALWKAESLAHFMQHSGHFPLTSGGRVNTYAVFAGLARKILSLAGRAGVIVPTGIATDYTYRDFFADIVTNEQLVSLYDFENRRKLFPKVDSRMGFSLLTLVGTGWPSSTADFAFFLHSVDDLADEERHFSLSREDLALMNPNTHTVPVFRSRSDAELTRRIYRNAPVLVNDGTGDNPWEVGFRQGLFNMTSDSHLFRRWQELNAECFEVEHDRFVKGDIVYVPLYEGRMVHQFNHRYATFDRQAGEYASIQVISLSRVETEYWAPLTYVDERLERQSWTRNWLYGLRRVARNT